VSIALWRDIAPIYYSVEGAAVETRAYFPLASAYRNTRLTSLILSQIPFEVSLRSILIGHKVEAYSFWII